MVNTEGREAAAGLLPELHPASPIASTIAKPVDQRQPTTFARSAAAVLFLIDRIVVDKCGAEPLRLGVFGGLLDDSNLHCIVS